MNASRERQKQEAVALARHVAELERELIRLRERREQMLYPHSGGEPDSAVLVWENMATRQFQSRRRAELLNVRLREMLSRWPRTSSVPSSGQSSPDRCVRLLSLTGRRGIRRSN